MSVDLQHAAIGGVVAEATFGPLDYDDLRRYAAASGDLNPLHLDPAFARRAGFEDVIVHGMFGMALLGRLLNESFPAWRLQRFRTRFRHVIPIGESIVCVARMDSVSDTAANLTLTAGVLRSAILIDGDATLAPMGPR